MVKRVATRVHIVNGARKVPHPLTRGTEPKALTEPGVVGFLATCKARDAPEPAARCHRQAPRRRLSCDGGSSSGR
jgi:hypothetical protein